MLRKINTLLERNMTNKYTSPDIRAAGKLKPTRDTVKKCLQEIIPRPITPPEIRKFRSSGRPDAGTVRVFHGKANDPDHASGLIHGVSTKASLTGGLLINPTPKTLYQQKLQNLQEANYYSMQKAPLGRSHDQSRGLPAGLDIDTTTFGVKCLQSVNAGEIINPPKSTEQVEKEAQDGHLLYIRSHNSYFVGERVNWKYNWSQFETNSRFGISTPHYNDGRRVGLSLCWMQNDGKLVSKRCDDFRERTQPQIGKVHDPIAETLNVPEGHTFGILMHPDKFGAGDLLHLTPPEEYLTGTDRQRALVTAVRLHLKKANFLNFSSLLQAFRHYDRKGQGMIDKEDLQDVCRQFNLDLSSLVLTRLMDYCDVDKDGRINFLEFANFLNWKDKMPVSKLEEQILTRGHRCRTAPVQVQRTEIENPDGVNPEVVCSPLIKPEDLEEVDKCSVLKTPRTLARPKTVPDRFVTSSSLIRAVVGSPSTANFHTYGIPSVRTDLPAPRVKRISDRRNYGDESTAYGLLYPTLYSLRGIHEEHFFTSRTKEEIAEIFLNVGVNVTEEMFEEAWKLASMRHPRGEVCVETFRNALTEMQADLVSC